MKAILKVIWFAVAVVLLQRYGSNIISENRVGSISDKLTAYFPSGIQNALNLRNIYNQTVINDLIFIIILFLGLDIISGDIKGIIKGPIKLAFNGVLYVIGFSVLFFLLKDFSISL